MASIQPTICTARTGEQFMIRTARPEDGAALLAYICPIAEETEFFVLEPDEFPATVEQEQQWVQDHLDSPGKLLLLAEAAGTIIGNVSFENGAHRRIAHRGSLGIAVVEEWRGRGVGTAMLEALLNWATDNPMIEKVCQEVFATNGTAIRLYKRLGFVEEGLRPKDIRLEPGRYVNTVAMYRFVK